MLKDQFEDIRENGKADVETIVGPSVKVEGDFVSQGNVVIEGQVVGSVRTDKDLRVEEGAKINANVSASNARVAGEVRGNVKISDTIELTPSARVLGDVEAKTLIVAAGAVLHGRCIMADEKMEKTPAVKKNQRTKVEMLEPAFENAEASL